MTNEGVSRMNRRDVLRLGGTGAVVVAGARWLTACDPGPPAGSTTTLATTTTVVPPTTYGPLGATNGHGLRLPAGFTSRVIATSGYRVPGTEYVWPGDPDGAATFALPDGGWVYVQNHESYPPFGGVSRIVFAADGTVVGAERLLGGTTRNCAGGATPWGTWLSGEEVDTGRIWEVDAFGVNPPAARPAMGVFNHEAAAVHVATQTIYLTEDKPDGALYRFRPDTYPDLASGLLEVLTLDGETVVWAEVPDPSASSHSTRNQVAGTHRFDGGEGICVLDGVVYFTTKGDNRVWSYSPATNQLAVRYDAVAVPMSALSGVDNLTSRASGDLFVAEDGGDMQVVMISGGVAEPIVQVSGVDGSEMTGVVFDPSGTRMYVTAQRNPGRVYEISGPWV